MLPTNLTSNEVKNSAGTEEEFLAFDRPAGRKIIFAKSGEAPNLLHRITFQHEEQGVGLKLKRRSNRSIVKWVLSPVDGLTYVPIIDSRTLLIPVGYLEDFTEVKNVVANGLSLDASIGASTTILYNCDGYGAAALVNGTL